MLSNPQAIKFCPDCGYELERKDNKKMPDKLVVTGENLKIEKVESIPISIWPYHTVQDRIMALEKQRNDADEKINELEKQDVSLKFMIQMLDAKVENLESVGTITINIPPGVMERIERLELEKQLPKTCPRCGKKLEEK